MKKSILSSLPLVLLLIGCGSPQDYAVNPNPEEQRDGGSVPESQQEDYMRIVGDLRWDKLTTLQDWMKRFPGCLKPSKQYKDVASGIDYYSGKRVFPDCKGISIGEIKLIPTQASITKSTRTPSGTMTRNVIFTIQDDAQERAFMAALKEKYEENQEFVSIGEYSGTSTKYCSKYTCWNGTSAYPTPYTISILDNVKVDESGL